MKIKSRRDFASGIVLVIVGFAFAVGATNYDFGSALRPGPGYFPFGLGILLALLGLVILCTSLTRGKVDGDPIGDVPWRPLICIVGALVLFGYALPRVGFLVSFPVMIVLTSAGSREFAWQGALLNAALLTALCYGLFIYGLQLNIPLWPT